MPFCPKCNRSYSPRERFCSLDGAQLVERASPDATIPPPISEDLIDDRYRIIAQIGEGGMGAIFLAQHEALGREVAIKFLRRGLLANEGAVQRFLLEAQAASRLEHENIVFVYDFGRDERGRYFIVLEYVVGQELVYLINEEGRLDQQRSIHILRQILAASSAAHAAGIVHRDLKPENVICTTRRDDHDFVKVLDFGLAMMIETQKVNPRLTGSGCVVGTPEYMSPEHAGGETLDGRSDLYSIGVIAFKMLTGKLPFTGPPPAVLSDQLLKPPPSLREVCPELELHPDLELFVMTLLAKSPDERFQTAEACLAVLDRIEAELEDDETMIREGVLEQTRAELKPRTSTASRLIRQSEGPETMDLDTRDLEPVTVEDLEHGPGLYSSQTISTLWEIPDVIREVSRLGELWNRRLQELSDQLWSQGQRPHQIEEELRALSHRERLVAEHEEELSLSRAKVDELDRKLRSDEQILRRHRVKIVAKLRDLEEALGLGKADPEALLEESFSGGLEGPHLLPGYSDPAEMASAREALKGDLTSLDDETQRICGEHRKAISIHEKHVREIIEKIKDLREGLISAYTRLSDQITLAAKPHPALREHTSALSEVTGAMHAYQTHLRAAG